MLKIVIVDDEIRQCRGLKNILLKRYKNLEVEAFTSADKALSYIEREQVRIIITDICMPEMDGLALTAHLKKLDGGAKIILLTGYAEFEYARKAISLGAFDYLLKPLNPDKLREVLEKAFRELEQEEILRQQHEKMQQQLDMTLPVYMEKLLNQWVYGWMSDEKRQEVEKVIPAGEDGFVIAARLPGFTRLQAELDKEEAAEVKNQVIWRIKEKITRPWHSLSFFSNVLSDTMITVVTCKEYENRPDRKWLVSRLENTALEVTCSTGILQFDYVAGIGELHADLLHSIELCYKSAVTVLQYAFYFPGEHLLYAEQILPRSASQIQISLAEEELIREALKQARDGTKAVDAFDAILVRCLANGYPEPGHLKNSFESLLRHVALSMRLEPVFRYHGDTEQHFEQFTEQVRSYLRRLANDANAGRSEKNTEFAERFYTWLSEHYREEISLDDIADYVGLTPAYCSAMIKETTGTSFSKSLIGMRIGKAKELLLNTKKKIYEIAMETGYSDVKYFNRVFKKETGITPVHYRKELKEIKGWERCGD